MKGHTRDYPYKPLVGLNPFNEALAENARTLEYMAQEQTRTARLLAYFATFDAVTSDDVRSISVSGGTSLTFNLDVSQSRFVHALARFTGLTFEKKRAYDGQSLRFEAKLPEQHPLALIGLTSISVADYLPDSCKVVVDGHTPLSDAERTVYERLLAEGRPVYKTVCDDVEEADASDIEPIPVEPLYESVEVPF